MVLTEPREPSAGTLSTDETKITAWRKEQLELAGYSEPHVKAISRRHTGPDAIDLHKAVLLVTPKDKGGKGCDPHVAADILL
jgi:hypothetical protein